MKEETALKIGEFARLSQVSIKTLRHYDSLGLLQPCRIDPESGYRQYDLGQLADMMRILALKDCGFALDEIAQLLRTHDAQAILSLLSERVVAQQQVVAKEQTRLQRLMARVKQLTAASQTPPHDIALKRTEPLTLIGLRRCNVMRPEIDGLARSVLAQFEQQAILPIGPMTHLYFGGDGTEEGFEIFVGAPVTALPANITELSCERRAGGEQVACILLRGDYSAISEAYIALNMWIASSGYHSVGPCCELYHRSPVHTTDPASYLTEIQIPIQENRL